MDAFVMDAALLSRKPVPTLQVCGALDLARVALAPARHLVLARLPRLSLQAKPRELLRFHATARLHKRRAAHALREEVSLREEVTETRRRLRQQSKQQEA